MLKVFFVEDEAILRNGIKNNIRWEQTNFIFTGAAGDGIEALPLIREIIPDILVTDIKMPFMNGLELSKIVKNEIPETKIIILIGHDEFEFAREALSIGVYEYLLKPFSSSKLLEVLDKVTNEIKREKLRKIRDYEKYVLEKSSYKEIKPSAELHMFDELSRFATDNIDEFLKTGAKQSVSEFLDGFIEKFKDIASGSYLYTYFLFMNLVLKASKFLSDIGGDIDVLIPETKELETLCLNLDSLDKFKKYASRILEAVLSFRDDKKQNKYGDIILTAKEFIKKNYSNPYISLNDVAGHVNISPNHFSYIFKQQTGKAFIDYLTDVRVKKAMEILQTTSSKATEIAAAVGYSDSHYFCHIFKKATKCTPTEFRNIGKQL